MTSFEKTLMTALVALLLGGLLAFGAPSAMAYAADGEQLMAQNYDARRNMELTNQRVPLETVISRIQSQCPGRLVNARHDASTNLYIVRWETSRQQIVSIQADAATGRILSGGC